MSDEPYSYHAYLLRLWRTEYQGQWQWHASLESPHTRERQLFSSLEQLFAFISELCEDQAPGTDQEEPEGQQK
jgi:hypothetical protein